MKLYTKCQWGGDYTQCDRQDGCPNSPHTKLLAGSASGSGWGECAWKDPDDQGNPSGKRQQRKYCCEANKEKETFGDYE